MVEKREKAGKYEVLFDRKPVLEDVSDVIGIASFGDAYGKNHYQNLMTGKRSSKVIDVLRYSQRNIFYLLEDTYQATIGGFYAEYVEEFDAIVVYTVSLQVHDIKEGEKRSWKDTKAAFIFLKDGTVYQYNSDSGIYYNYFDIFQNRFDICKNEFYLEGSYMFNAESFNYCAISNHTNDACRKLYGAGFCFPGGVQTYSFGKNEENKFAQICMASNMPVSEIDVATGNKLVKENGSLRDINLDDVMPFFQQKHIPKNAESYESELTTNTVRLYRKELLIGFLQSVRKGESAIRVYRVRADVRGFTMSVDKSDILYKEMYRFYWKNKKLDAVVNYFGNWITTSKAEQDLSSLQFILLPWKPEDSVGTSFAYLDNYFADIFNRALALDDEINSDSNYWESYKNLEKMTVNVLKFTKDKHAGDIFASPFENIKEMIANRLQDSRLGLIAHDMFGLSTDLTDEYEHFMNALDVPSHMVQTFDKLIGEYSNGKGYDKKNYKYMIAGTAFIAMNDYFVFAPEYFKSMNKEQFEDLCRTYIESRSLHDTKEPPMTDSNSDIHTISRLIELRGPQNAKEYIKYSLNYLNFCIMNSESGKAMDWCDVNRIDIHRLYLDYLSMCNTLLSHGIITRKPEWKFKTTDEIRRAHNEICEIYLRFQDADAIKRCEEDFEKQKPNWEKYSYAEDEYSVIPPQTPQDVINEGFYLHHCVRSYLDNISLGKTDIVFIRRSKELDKPFYTLEVRDGEIRQCHGFANCNVSEEKGLDLFLQRFCEEKNVVYTDGKKVLAAR